jgi:hypothetical protein
MQHHTIENEDVMSGNSFTRTRRGLKKRTVAGAAVAALCVATAAFMPVTGTTHAADAMSEGLKCTNGSLAGQTRSFDLHATDGYTSEPDGNAVYDWSYTARGSFQLPGPVLCANQGELIDVALTDDLPVATSIQFPGQSKVAFNDGVNADVPVGPVADATGNLLSLVQEAQPGTTVHYKFVADHAGTYLYQSGSDPQLQVQMGLFGSMVITPRSFDAGTNTWSPIVISASDIQAIPADDPNSPNGMSNNGALGLGAPDAGTAAAKAKCAYASLITPTKCDPLAIYDGDRENILMLSEVDPGLHAFIEQHKADPADGSGNKPFLHWNGYTGAYQAHYYMINGRSMPDTIAPNDAPWLPSQPYGSLASVQPWDVHVNPLDAMLRYVGIGVTGYDFHPHSNHEHVIAEDGALMKAANGDNNTEEKFNLMVSPGATLDATFRWTNEEGYADTAGHRLPVQWPQSLNLTEGDFWSGSPYLGASGQLNPGILGTTQCGEYYHVAHSHDLTQVTNYGITFGGMLTLIQVQPPQKVQDTTNVHCGG